MMRFVTMIKFTNQGVSKLKQSPARAKKFAAQAKAIGVHVETLLWTQGRYDGLILFDAPDAETAAALTLDLAAKGNVKTETMVAFDSAEMEKIFASLGKG
jgi:uncharacterized protein with GYD domain